MEKLGTLSDYLHTKGVNEKTPEATIEEHKKAYWKSYHKQYYQQRKKGYHRFTLRLDQNEYKRLHYYAQQHQGKKMTSFIKAAALAYIEKNYVPRQPKLLQEITIQIRKIGNVINQVVQSLHRTAKRKGMTGAYAEEGDLKKLQREYEFLVKRVSQLEKVVHDFIQEPPKRVGEALTEMLSQQPEKIPQVRTWLDELEQRQKK